jgi:hypothetical protein
MIPIPGSHRGFPGRAALRNFKLPVGWGPGLGGALQLEQTRRQLGPRAETTQTPTGGRTPAPHSRREELQVEEEGDSTGNERAPGGECQCTAWRW